MGCLNLRKPEEFTEHLQASLKDRFNYASFSCAALVLSSSKDSMYSSSVLNNNKDQYMLAKCPSHVASFDALFAFNEGKLDAEDSLDLEHKNFKVLTNSSYEPLFITIELCSDIKIETIVIGNNEYFSSTFRHFSLWTSASYPPKTQSTTTSDEFQKWLHDDMLVDLDSAKPPTRPILKKGWKLLGFFEASNIRGPQAFKIRNSEAFTKYLRLEVHSHYGNEFYCPITSLKVFGNTMIEDFKESEDKERERKELLDAIHSKPSLALDASTNSFLTTILEIFNITKPQKLTPPVQMIGDPHVHSFPDIFDPDDDASSDFHQPAKIIHVHPGYCNYFPPDPFKAFLPARCLRGAAPGDLPTTIIRSSSSPLPQPRQPSKVAGQSSHDNIFKSINDRLKYLEYNSTLSYNFLEEQTEKLNEALLKVEQVAIQASFKTRDELGFEINEKFDTLKSQLACQWKNFEKDWPAKLVAFESKVDGQIRDQFDAQVFYVGLVFIVAQILAFLFIYMTWQYGASITSSFRRFLRFLYSICVTVSGEFIVLRGTPTMSMSANPQPSPVYHSITSPTNPTIYSSSFPKKEASSLAKVLKRRKTAYKVNGSRFSLFADSRFFPQDEVPDSQHEPGDFNSSGTFSSNINISQ